jgi:hypothetical protein
VKLVYLHIPKTAGMTLREVITRQYRKGEIFQFGEHHREEIKQFLALSQAERDKIQCVVGHVHYGIHRYWSEDATYITLLRDPVERTISGYYHILRNPRHPRYEHYRSQSLLDYAQKETRGERQTRWIYGFREDSGLYGDEHPLPANALEVAKERLRKEFRVVGVVEEFDKTLLLLQKAFGWKHIHYVAQNVNESRPASEKIDAETLKILRENSEPDYTLYQYAKSLFAEQVEAYEGSIERDLKNFQQRNAIYGRVRNVFRR